MCRTCDHPVARYVISGGQMGYDRLQVLARAWHPATSTFLDRVGVEPGMRCLDLGCGSGAVTFEIAKRVGSGGSVTGIDLDDVQLKLVRQDAAARGIRNVEFRAMNVNDFAETDAYDLVYCRLLLQHLSRPADVLRRMWAAVRSGGAIAVEDSDFEGQFCYPPNDGYTFWAQTYPQVLQRHGGDPLTGRKLLALFAEAGIPEPNLQVVQRVEVGGDAKLIPYLTIEATADAIVTEGLATNAEVQAALVSLAALGDDRTTIFGSPRHFQASAQRLPASVEATM
jgi:ubiquinone/menaquinone biosynthesis C-methylase UbiE